MFLTGIVVHQVLQALEGEPRGDVVPVVGQSEDAVMLHLPVPHGERVEACRKRRASQGRATRAPRKAAERPAARAAAPRPGPALARVGGGCGTPPRACAWGSLLGDRGRGPVSSLTAVTTPRCRISSARPARRSVRSLLGCVRVLWGAFGQRRRLESGCAHRSALRPSLGLRSKMFGPSFPSLSHQGHHTTPSKGPFAFGLPFPGPRSL